MITLTGGTEFNMGIWEIISAAVLILVSILTVVVVALQNHNSSGISALAGAGAQQYNKANERPRDRMLSNVTKYVAGVLFVLTIIVNLIKIFFS